MLRPIEPPPSPALPHKGGGSRPSAWRRCASISSESALAAHSRWNLPGTQTRSKCMNSTRSSHGLNVGVTSLPDQPTPQAVAEFRGAAFWQNEASHEPVIKLAAVGGPTSQAAFWQNEASHEPVIVTRPFLGSATQAAFGRGGPQAHTSRLCTIAASTKDENSGCGSNGRDLSSGWNWTPTNHGWSAYSMISG